MPRIIAGTLGGRTLAAPPGDGTRPTSDRVREAMFSRLVGWDAIADVRVLDLFAGSGALALEALSRGARSADLVEAHARTARLIARSVRELGLESTARVRTARAATILPSLVEEITGGAAEPFGLVFLDPPYDHPTPEVEQLIARLAPALTPDAVLVVERSSRSAPLAWPPGFADDGAKTYGETTVHYGGPAP
ncbi:MAG: 16S rRNA (guanine(966)-N(2))-methyltransferase RsmD [Brachybacterium sp.]|nr:16S rRNA (guanine(966)-N(2))-methyltransferase RsmD [Brachybacterium sp.]